MLGRVVKQHVLKYQAIAHTYTAFCIGRCGRERCNTGGTIRAPSRKACPAPYKTFCALCTNERQKTRPQRDCCEHDPERCKRVFQKFFVHVAKLCPASHRAARTDRGAAAAAVLQVSGEYSQSFQHSPVDSGTSSGALRSLRTFSAETPEARPQV